MERVIIYDKDARYSQTISNRIKEDVPGIIVDTFIDIESLKEALLTHVDQYVFSIIDIDSEEDKCEEVIKLISTQYIPMIVLTSKENIPFRHETMENYPLIDFIIKDGHKNFLYITSLIEQMKSAISMSILLVCNSQHDRDYIYNNLLVRYPFDIIDAKDIDEVADVLENEDSVKIMMIDIQPAVEGLDLVEHIREFEKKDNLAIMAITSKDDSYTAARYLQLGANDFVTKPIQVETFQSRMNVLIETLSLFDKLQQIANIDYLTKLYNRRYFFESGNMLFANAKRKNISITTAMLDIDHFKSINDTYGHHAGDIVLKEISQVLKDHFRNSDLVARVGGEEFAAILVDAEKSSVSMIFEKLRAEIESLEIQTDQGMIQVTISIGITNEVSNTLSDTMNIADENLYEAKETGRNKLIFK